MDAENEYERAKSKVLAVEDLKAIAGGKYNSTKKKLTDKEKTLQDVLARIAALNARAQKAVGDVQVKMTDLSDLTNKYKSNEKAAEDLSLLIKRLTVKARFTRDRLQELSKCHATCNPELTGKICQVQLSKIKVQEDAAYAALQS